MQKKHEATAASLSPTLPQGGGSKRGTRFRELRGASPTKERCASDVIVDANHEALALAQRYGMDPEMLREALKTSSADNYVLRNWRVNTMAWAEDDMEIVQEMAADRGIALPQAGLNRELCRLLKPKRFKLDEYGV